jgi:hypothetical protein
LGLLARRVAVPLLLVLILTLGAMGYYFWRTTGSPWRTPYQVGVETYEPVPYFPWQALRPVPAYYHDVLRPSNLGLVLEWYRESHALAGLAHMKLSGLVGIWSFSLGPLLTLPFFAVVAAVPYGFSWRDAGQDTRFLGLVCGAVTAGIMLPIVLSSPPHYAALLTLAIYALLLQAMRKIRGWQWRSRSTGLFITRAVPLVCLLLLLLRVAASPCACPCLPSGLGR